MWVDGELVDYRRRGNRLCELHEREASSQRAKIGIVFRRFNLSPNDGAVERQ
jgi:ABC-type polar amino acid transport system ATPase subunit